MNYGKKARRLLPPVSSYLGGVRTECLNTKSSRCSTLKFLKNKILYINCRILGTKHTSSGDDTPPIPEEELEQQKIEHEKQLQKEKECQAREAEEVRKLDIKLLHQRAIEAEEEHRREIAEAVEELRGLNTSWSHHRLCDLQRQAAKWRHSRPSIPDTRHYRNAMKKACNAQLTKPQSSQSMGDAEGIFINLSRLGSCRDESIDSDGCCETPCCEHTEECGGWRASANDISPIVKRELVKTPSCPGYTYIYRVELSALLLREQHIE